MNIFIKKTKKANLMYAAVLKLPEKKNCDYFIFCVHLHSFPQRWQCLSKQDDLQTVDRREQVHRSAESHAQISAPEVAVARSQTDCKNKEMGLQTFCMTGRDSQSSGRYKQWPRIAEVQHNS